MPRAPLPRNESSRLASLHALEILDTPPEQDFDDVVMLASHICGVPIALVSLVDGDRQWFKAKIGLEATETHRDMAFCAHAILGEEVMVVNDAQADERFADNPLVTGDPNIRFYAGAPLHDPDGEKIGTLCVIDRKPRELTAPERAALVALKRQVESQLVLRRSQRLLAQANADLVELQGNKDALVQYVVHDMKNSLSAVVSNAHTLAGRPPSPGEVKAVARDIGVAGETLRRLVFDMMDISRHEHGGELVVMRQLVPLDRIVKQLATTFMRRLEDAGITLSASVSGLCPETDPDLLTRVLENLVDNAVRHSPSGSEVIVSATRTPDATLIMVSDHGPGIPAEARESIFDLYESSPPQTPTQAQQHASTPVTTRTTRGIGLAFCRMATRAMGGRIWVEPNGARGSRFCVAI